MLTGACADTLLTNPSGHAVTGVRVQRQGRTEAYSADIVVVACGALSSAAFSPDHANLHSRLTIRAFQAAFNKKHVLTRAPTLDQNLSRSETHAGQLCMEGVLC